MINIVILAASLLSGSIEPRINQNHDSTRQKQTVPVDQKRLSDSLKDTSMLKPISVDTSLVAGQWNRDGVCFLISNTITGNIDFLKESTLRHSVTTTELVDPETCTYAAITRTYQYKAYNYGKGIRLRLKGINP